MRNYLSLLFLCSLTLLFTAMTCNDGNLVEAQDVLFENRSGDSIFFAYQYGYDISKPSNPLNPYMVFINEPPYYISGLADQETFEGLGFRKGKSDYIYLIIFKKETMDKYTQEELAEQNIYDTLYTLSYSELEKMNFKIIYTGE